MPISVYLFHRSVSLSHRSRSLRRKADVPPPQHIHQLLGRKSTTVRPTSLSITYEASTTTSTSPTPTIPILVMLTGTAGTCVGSRIKGHAPRGGGKLRGEHRRYAVVDMTNEFCTSKTCVYWYSRIRQANTRRLINGGMKAIRLNGAVECIEPSCLSLKGRHTIDSRDPMQRQQSRLQVHPTSSPQSARPSPHFPQHIVPPNATNTKNASPELEEHTALDIDLIPREPPPEGGLT